MQRENYFKILYILYLLPGFFWFQFIIIIILIIEFISIYIAKNGCRKVFNYW